MHQLDPSRIQVIGFDADDTLWHNEMIFRDAEAEVARLLGAFEVEHVLLREMYAMEMKNLDAYGYGIKGFTLSMIELVSKVTGGAASAKTYDAVLAIGKRMLLEPVRIIDGVRETVDALTDAGWKLVVITKGDLLDQERKLERSGIADRFHHVEVVSNKTPSDYRRALARMDLRPEEFLMIGNSLKSDVLPLLELGAQAVHVPYEVTWDHEVAQAEAHHAYVELAGIWELVELLEGGAALTHPAR